MIVSINDYQNNRFLTYSITEADMEFVDSVWDRGDKLLEGLQETELFEGYKTWSSLMDFHFQFLLSSNILKLDELSIEEVKDETNPTITSIRFLLSCYIFLMENPCQQVREIIIDRVKNDVMVFNLSLRSVMNLTVKAKPTPFKVIVDNTRGE